MLLCYQRLKQIQNSVEHLVDCFCCLLCFAGCLQVPISQFIDMIVQSIQYSFLALMIE